MQNDPIGQTRLSHRCLHCSFYLLPPLLPPLSGTSLSQILLIFLSNQILRLHVLFLHMMQRHLSTAARCSPMGGYGRLLASHYLYLVALVAVVELRPNFYPLGRIRLGPVEKLGVGTAWHMVQVVLLALLGSTPCKPLEASFDRSLEMEEFPLVAARSRLIERKVKAHMVWGQRTLDRRKEGFHVLKEYPAG